MLGISKRKCTMDTPVHINGNEKKKKTEYRNYYITYLNIQNVIPMCYLLVFGVWLWTELHISTNLNIFWINALLCVAIILSSFKSLKYRARTLYIIYSFIKIFSRIAYVLFVCVLTNLFYCCSF